VEDSPSWRAFSGQTLEEYRGLGWLDAIHPDDRAAVWESWCKARDAEAPHEVEYRARRHDGIYRHLLVRVAPVVGEDGRVDDWIMRRARGAAGGFAATAGRVVGEVKAAKVDRDATASARLPRRAPRLAAAAAGKSIASAGRGFCRCWINLVGVVPQRIVDLALFLIAQDVIGFRNFLEFFFRLLIPGIDIGVVLARKLPEGFSDVVRSCRLLDSKKDVIIFCRCSCHVCSGPIPNMPGRQFGDPGSLQFHHSRDFFVRRRRHQRGNNQ